MKCEIVTTTMGARAIVDHESGEVMHPKVGPLIEAEHLYVAPAALAQRLGATDPRPLRLLDVGLGAGSNAIAAWKTSAARPVEARPLEIISLDRTTDALRLALAHPTDFGLDGPVGSAARALLEQGHSDGPRTRWRLVLGELPGSLAAIEPDSVDVVFWDPFSPRVNGALWTYSAFAALRRVARAGCTIHTYSASTAVRSALLLAGFAVGLGPAIDEHKRATTATLDVPLREPLDARWLE